ncbi:MAG: type II toxin-antitoxin system VapC family toxin [Tildeniella nuda ZEHNDER 1965/U140]|jgi:PIN domain nuclease of toxin-antitoxin system|nr:type II toxin-antitoxin system VapC family toxin [Tildeniella nuda ZEHNDER 1965/U140]
MIVLDTHIWLWWVHGDSKLTREYYEYIQQQESQGLGISAISCWEVAKLVEYGRLTLPSSVDEWLNEALSYPGVNFLELTPKICIEATQLPGSFHRDPADQIIVATARVHNCPIVTVDRKIREYSYVDSQP